MWADRVWIVDNGIIKTVLVKIANKKKGCAVAQNEDGCMCLKETWRNIETLLEQKKLVLVAKIAQCC